jgi:hypothetical protein
MNLYEHPDFEQAILRAEEHFPARGLRPAIIEKDLAQRGMEAFSFLLGHLYSET